MCRAPLLSLLSSYRDRVQGDSAACARVDRILTFVSREPRCFLRENAEGHVTGSAWIVDASGEACLLTHHKKLDLWIQLGGHADGESDISAVALREATEESGIAGLEVVRERIFDVDVHRIPARPREPEHLHFDIRFLVRAPPRAQFRVSEESHALRWFRRDEVREVTREASVLRMADRWLGIGHP